MRLVCLTSVAVLALAAGNATAEEIENPEFTAWAKHKKGTSVTTKSIVTTNGMPPIEQTLTRKLVEVGADKVAIATEVTIKAGTQILKPNALLEEIPKTLTLKKGEKKEDVLAGRPANTVEEGTEVMKLAGVEVKARWFRTKSDKAEGTVWLSDAVPGRLVKQVRTEGGQVPVTSLLELSEIKKP